MKDRRQDDRREDQGEVRDAGWDAPPDLMDGVKGVDIFDPDLEEDLDDTPRTWGKGLWPSACPVIQLNTLPDGRFPVPIELEDEVEDDTEELDPETQVLGEPADTLSKDGEQGD